MDENDGFHLARLTFRTVGLLVFVLAGLTLVANLFETMGTVSLAYWKSFLKSEVFRPLTFMAGGLGLYFFGATLARRASK
ncbi:MAG: hypothetical protein ACFCU4_06360 [Puniceicoccaceae bacterium]